jgi:myo-inositol-1(or 4)-monophosphatase
MAIVGFEATPKIWDIAASWLIVNESGGAIESFDSSQPFPLRANYDYRLTSFPILAGATSELVSKSRVQIKLK